MAKEDNITMNKVVFTIDDTFPDDPEYYRRRKMKIPDWLKERLKKEKLNGKSKKT